MDVFGEKGAGEASEPMGFFDFYGGEKHDEEEKERGEGAQAGKSPLVKRGEEDERERKKEKGRRSGKSQKPSTPLRQKCASSDTSASLCQVSLSLSFCISISFFLIPLPHSQTSPSLYLSQTVLSWWIDLTGSHLRPCVIL